MDVKTSRPTMKRAGQVRVTLLATRSLRLGPLSKHSSVPADGSLYLECIRRNFVYNKKSTTSLHWQSLQCSQGMFTCAFTYETSMPFRAMIGAEGYSSGSYWYDDATTIMFKRSSRTESGQ